MAPIRALSASFPLLFILGLLANIAAEALGLFSSIPHILSILMSTSLISIYIAVLILAEDRLMKIYLAAVLVVSTIFSFLKVGFTPSMVGIQGGCLMLFTLLGMVLLPRRLPADRQAVWQRHLVDFSAISLFFILFLPALHLTTIALSTVYDYHILALQDALGLRWTIDMIKHVPEGSPLFQYCGFAYFSILGTVVLMRAAEIQQKSPGNIFTLFIAAAVVGYASYYVTPGIGPPWTIPAFPNDIPAPGDYAVATFTAPYSAFPRNAMISLHTAWAILMILSALSLGRWISILFIVMGLSNIAATLVLRMHWVLDLVPSVSLAVGVYLAFWNHPPTHRLRLRLVASLAAIIVFWLVVVRTSPMLFARHPWLGEAALVLSLVWPILALAMATGRFRASRPLPSPPR